MNIKFKKRIIIISIFALFLNSFLIGATALAEGGVLFGKDGVVDQSNVFIWDDVNKQLGIGTGKPIEALTVSDGNILSTGKLGVSPKISSSGAGTRLMWIPYSAAFRAGGVDADQWDAIKIGNYSVAFGQDNIASGTNSFTTGTNSQATNQATVAMGTSVKASGTAAVAMGHETVASGNRAVAMGNTTIASGSESVAMGNETRASGTNAVAMGFETVAGGTSSLAIGDNAKAQGNWAVSIGRDTTASGINALAFGQDTIASGEDSMAVGKDTTAQAYASMVMGRWNEVIGSINSWIPDDPLFVIGNGTNSDARSNALTVLKNGNVGIGTSTPKTALHIKGAFSIETTTMNIATYTVLATDHIIVSNFSIDGVSTIILPDYLVFNGSNLTIIDGGGLSSVNPIRFITIGTALINGQSSISVSKNHGIITFFSDGTNWYASRG